jgi:hypothetical protein
MKYNELSVQDRAKIIRMHVKNGITKLLDIEKSYNEFSEGGSITRTGAPYANIEEDLSDRTGMMKARMALANEFGNNSAKRMVSPNPKTGMTPDGIGTHYMASMGNDAVPLLQDTGKEQLEFIQNPKYNPKEDIRFDSPQDAQYFAQHYKKIAPMMKSNIFQDGGNLFKDGGEKTPLMLQPPKKINIDLSIVPEKYSVKSSNNNYTTDTRQAQSPKALIKRVNLKTAW